MAKKRDRRKPFIASDLETEYGVVQPGDKIAIVTTGRSRANIHIGTYEGYRLGRTSPWNQELKKMAVVSYIITSDEWYWPETGEPYDWSNFVLKTWEKTKEKLATRKIHTTYHSTLKRNRIIPLEKSIKVLDGLG